jgi:formylmethanofuran dehydrogenase subunit C
MKLKHLMDEAYQGKARAKRLETRRGDLVFGLEDLADRVGLRPFKADVEALLPSDKAALARLISADPGKKYRMIWGYITAIAAERSFEPLSLRLLQPKVRDFVGLEMSGGVIVMDVGGDHVGEKMKGGRIFVREGTGSHLGHEMSGGGIVAGSCGNYAFRNMRGGWGVVLGDAGNFTGLGNSGGRIAVRESSGERSGWLMHSGRLRIRGDAGDYLGLLMSGGEILVGGRAGSRAGWRMKGGSIKAGSFGPEAGVGSQGGSILGLGLE